MKKLFRTWDGKEFDYMSTIWNGVVWNPKMDCELEGSIIEQLLGKNKKGDKVYEGDIINAEYGPGTIEFCDDSLTWKYQFALDSDNLGYYINDCEIIGNIHQNPELL